MQIGAVARQADVGVETIRFYERKGLIDRPPRPKDGGFRAYLPEAVGRIRFIRQAQDLGFSLKEITELLSLRADPSTDCEDVRNQARGKLKEVDRKIARLNQIRAGLKGLIAACPGEGAVQSCSIMEALESEDGALAHHQSSRSR
jgi:Hg(II)-responsive transcriptional regulator